MSEAVSPATGLTEPEVPARALETYVKFLAEEVWDYVGYQAQYEADCAHDREQGHRPHYCIHGTNQWTDYDNICGGCEDGLTVWDMAERAAWDRHHTYLYVLDKMTALMRGEDQRVVRMPQYVVDAYIQWLTEVSPNPVSPPNTKEN